MIENVELYAPIVIQWASTVPYSIRIYLFGSRIYDIPRDDSDLDIALEFLDSTDIENRDDLWFSYHGYWEKQLDRLLSCKPHLVLFEGDGTPLLKDYLRRGAVIYESDIDNTRSEKAT